MEGKPDTPGKTLEIVYLRPDDPTRTAISEYSDHFEEALRRLPNAHLNRFLARGFPERIDTRHACREIIHHVTSRANALKRSRRSLIVHAEMGNALHREFWAAWTLSGVLRDVPIVCTVHDPPTLCSNPYRFVQTEFAGRTPVRLLNVALTRLAEDMLHLRKRRIEQHFVRRCQGFAALSDAGTERLCASPLFRSSAVRKISHVFSRPAEARPMPQPEPGRPVRIGFFGFIAPEKGIETLVEAFEILSEHRPGSASLHIFGGISSRSDGQRWLDNLHIRIQGSAHAEHMHLEAGYLANAERDQKLGEIEILVLPFPHVDRVAFSSASVIRAMGLGRAVVAARSNALGEQIQDGETGLMFESGDPESLACRLEALIDDTDMRMHLAANARSHIQNTHTPEPVARQIEQWYANIVPEWKRD